MTTASKDRATENGQAPAVERKLSAVERAKELLDDAEPKRRAQMVAALYFSLREQLNSDLTRMYANARKESEPMIGAPATKDNPNGWVRDDSSGDHKHEGRSYITWGQRIGRAVDGLEALRTEHDEKFWLRVEDEIKNLEDTAYREEEHRLKKIADGEKEESA
jgi:hypothetical protein